MKYFSFFILLLLLSTGLQAQELFVFTEPASNMPAKSVGIRLANQGQLSPEFMNRSTAEVMVGFNKRFMTHLQGFFSNSDGKYRYEGTSVYGKYRFFSSDGLRSHSRAAVYLRVSDSKRQAISEDINLEGDNSGYMGGLVFTQLLHKLALSGNIAYARTFHRGPQYGPEVGEMPMPGMPGSENMTKMPTASQMISYSLSSGYLVLPIKYKDYNQPNFNAYFEVLGSTNPETGHSYIDFAPAVQVIINSLTRIDLGYRFEVSGNMLNRYNKNMYMAKVEFNLFNVLR
jgi:hypothetical protein